MPFRNILVKDRCKLEYSMNYLICRKGLEDKKILLDEIKMIVIDSTQVSITTSLISMLCKKKIKLLFSDELHNPIAELVPYQNNYYSYRKIKEQLSITDEAKDDAWQHIVIKKIINQANNLKSIGLIQDYDKLIEYSKNVSAGDTSNREGHAAKVYFNTLFGMDFNRHEDNDINKYLNYGYSILLSCINREIKMYGFLTELGIHHIGESNPFNLSCDLIEPLRPLIDYYVISNKINNDNFKVELVNLLSKSVIYNNQVFYLDNAIHLYINNVIEYLLGYSKKEIEFIEYEF